MAIADRIWKRWITVMENKKCKRNAGMYRRRETANPESSLQSLQIIPLKRPWNPNQIAAKNGAAINPMPRAIFMNPTRIPSPASTRSAFANVAEKIRSITPVIISAQLHLSLVDFISFANASTEVRRL